VNQLIEFLKEMEGTVFANEDGLKDPFRLRPPLSEQELQSFEAGLPCRLPEEIRELLRFCRGFDGVLSYGVDFAPPPFGLEDIFPSARELAADGFGNFWVVDLTSESTFFRPSF
jgi:hypothetical protein